MPSALPPLPLPPLPEGAVVFYRSGDTLRSRSVATRVWTTTLQLPAPEARLLADWQRDIAEQLALEPGAVEALSLPRARRRWPTYAHCVQAVQAWTQGLGLQGALDTADVALMACRGAYYHHDAVQYGGMAFCNVFLSEDKGLDLHFPGTGQRIALQRGTTVLFDTAQPHAVIDRHRAGFDVQDFAGDADRAQVFLTWELPLEQAAVAALLGTTWDVAPAVAAQLQEAQLWVHSAPATLCPATGRWLAAGDPS